MIGRDRDLINNRQKLFKPGCLGIARGPFALSLVSEGVVSLFREDLKLLELGVDHMAGCMKSLTPL